MRFSRRSHRLVVQSKLQILLHDGTTRVDVRATTAKAYEWPILSYPGGSGPPRKRNPAPPSFPLELVSPLTERSRAAPPPPRRQANQQSVRPSQAAGSPS
uniref:Uncharacterized protein n=1 Tax=Triticum urartu TaxID=4572 RepID=A0A8R7PMI4_TRIUA